MRGKLFFIWFCSLLPLFSFAQLDDEHWFAPMIDRTGNPNPYQTLYVSTNEVIPFEVKIYNNNNQIGTLTISKNNPGKFSVPRQYIIANTQAEAFSTSTKGLYVRGDKRFFANLRFSVRSHAEFVNSKGRAALGNEFYAAMAPISVINPILNFMVGILATENNTVINITNSNPSAIFSDGLTHPFFSITLNKGQSYIIDGSGSQAANGIGIIGSKITSNKPITITNGNFNGQYSGNFPNASDILMDQSLPTNRLGKEYAVIKGNGPIGNNMEGALVVAAENGTDIFLNGSTTPITSLNAGSYYRVPETFFVQQGANGHFNMSIKTSKNAYVYQLLAGDDEVSIPATGGFNLLPPLNCYLPKSIDQIGLIDENFVITNNNLAGILSIPTNLNLVTESGAIFTINGAAPPLSSGPYPLPGNSLWVTYTVPNVTGNITILSDKSITAGLAAGSDAVGYGGYFAGFPTSPEIQILSGTCAPGVVLSCNPQIYESYQWYRDAAPIPGATSPTFSPSQSGNYTVSVVVGTCSPLLSEPVPIQNCPASVASTFTVCGAISITPDLQNSSQVLNPASVLIVSQPTQGTVTVNAGVITYTPAAGYVGNDSFSYTFCGLGGDFPDCETNTVNITVSSISVQNAMLKSCGNGGIGTFNLSLANITSDNTASFQYYTTQADAQAENPSGLISFPNSFSSGATTVYAVVKNSAGCKKIAEIQLSLFPEPQFLNFNGFSCDDDLDGNITVNLMSLLPEIASNYSYFSVKFYSTAQNASQGINPLPPIFTYSQNTTVYAVFTSPDSCPPTIKPINLNFGTQFLPLTPQATQVLCDSDTDGIYTINPNTFNSLWTTDPTVEIQYFTSMADLITNTNAIPSTYIVNGNATLYVKLKKSGFCPGRAKLILQVRAGKKSDLIKNKEICRGKTVLMDAGPGFTSILWSNGETGEVVNLPIGEYYVDLTSNGCTFRQYFVISEIPQPLIYKLIVEKDGTLTVIATGGTPPLEYSVDGNMWQTSNVFPKLKTGLYTVQVRSAGACDPATAEVYITNLQNVITPNGDGANDMLDYSMLLKMENPKMEIYDRYYALLFVGNRENNYTWNGRLNNKNVSTATYWANVEWTEPKNNVRYVYSLWILVKNR